MFRTIRSITNFLTADHVKEAEMNYLNGSHDRIDLEHRMREIDRGKFRKSSNGMRLY